MGKRLLLSLCLLVGCQKSERDLSAPYSFVASVGINGSGHDVRYRADGQSISSIYVFPSSKESRLWLVERKSSGEFYLLDPECSSSGRVSLIYLNAAGECVSVEESVPDDVAQVMKNKGSVLDYAYRRIEEYLGEQ